MCALEKRHVVFVRWLGCTILTMDKAYVGRAEGMGMDLDGRSRTPMWLKEGRLCFPLHTRLDVTCMTRSSEKRTYKLGPRTCYNSLSPAPLS